MVNQQATDKIFSFKVVFLGDSTVGKTSILKFKVTGQYEETVSTVNSTQNKITLEYDGKSINAALWDTAGQEEYRSLTPHYLRDAKIAIIVFSVDDKASFDHLDNWFNLAKDTNSNPVIFLVGNKIDLKESDYHDDNAQKWSQDNEVTLHYTSAVTGEGIEELFDSIAAALTSRSPNDTNNLKITANKLKQCC